MGCDFLVYACAMGRIFSHRCSEARELIESVGLEKIFSLTNKELKELYPNGGRIIDEITNPSVLEWAQREIAWSKEYGIEVIYIEDERYPQRLKECCDAPVVLFYKGNCNLNQQRILSIVGTRRASYYGKESCRRIVEYMSHNKVKPLIVSGLAYGIDGSAHKAAIEYGLPTVGVLATGLDTIYPPAHRELAKKMVQNGGLLTDFTSGTTPFPNNFRRRNRIIAGMSDATALMESFKKGGGLITTALASSYSREVFALPGKISDDSFAGCNKLINDNIATIISDVDTIEISMKWEEKKVRKRVQRTLFYPEDPQKNLIIKALTTFEMLDADDIAYNTGITTDDLSLHLLEMELSGELKVVQGNKYALIR